MAIGSATGASATRSPNSAQAPKDEAKTPKDNTAAKQSPRETKTAVDNTFGKAQKGKENPASKDAPKLPASDAKSSPAGQGKSAPGPGAPASPKLAVTTPDSAPAPDPKSEAADSKTVPPVDPQVQSILDTKLPDGKSVKEKLDAETPSYIIKAAQDHYNLQKEKGEEPDVVSKFYLNNVAKFIAEKGVEAEHIPPEKLADVFDTDKIGKNIDELAKDPAFGKWVNEQQANAIQDTIAKTPDIAALIDPYKLEGENYVNALRRMQSDYMSSQDFADAVAKAKSPEDGKNLVSEGMKTLSAFGLGEKETLGVANSLSENIRSKYAPDTPKAVIDPETNKAVATEDGYNLATLPDGTHIALGTDGKPVADKQGNPYVYNADRTAKVDANNAYVQYNAKAQANFASYGGIQYLVDAEGKTMADAQGQPLVIDKEGGAPVVLGADGKVAVDAQGNKAVINPATGKQVVDPDNGNKVVIDVKTKAVVQVGADGKVVAAANGDPYAVDQKAGGFVKDAAGRYVQISKENVAPGIVPGYVVDGNNTKVVVNPINGKPLVDPGSGKTIIFTPGENAPELVPLDAGGKPLLSEDGKNIVYDLGGNTIVKSAGQGTNWLVTSDGKYANDGNGHYIGVGAKSGIASPVDAKGAPVQNANGQVPLWDTKTSAPMATADGNNQLVLDKEGNLLATDNAGKTLTAPETGLPYLIDPKTRSIAVNSGTGGQIMLDTSGAAVDYNAADGYKYLIDPKTSTTVKTAEGLVIVIDDTAAMPVAVNADGSKVKNPETGNTIVYGTDGKPVVEEKSGYKVEVTPDGKASLIDPKTNAPVGTPDKATGGIQLYSKDGSDLADPKTGNKVQLDPNGHHVEVDPKTGKFATDAYGNTLILGPDNTALKMPNGNAVVVDKTGAPVGVGADGKVELDPDSKLPRVINTETGKALEDPAGKASVVVDSKTGAPVHVDPKTGTPIVDPATGLTIVANQKTGEQAKGPNGEPIGVLPSAKAPVYYNKENNTLTLADPQTGKAVTNPKTGAQVVIDPQYGVPIQILPNKDGGYTVVDDDGRPRNDGFGNTLYLDKGTGQVVIKLPDDKVVDADTLEEAKSVDIKNLAKSVPFGSAWNAGGSAPGIPLPADNPDVPPPVEQPWMQPDYVTTAGERAEFVFNYTTAYDIWKQHQTDILPYAEEAAIVEKLKNMSGNEALKNIPTEDLVALRLYTRGGTFLLFNEMLYTGESLEGFEPYVKGIQSALNQMSKNGYAYEGPAVRFMKLKPDEFTSMFKEGGYFRNQQFLSTSYDMQWKWPGNVKLKFNNVKGVNIESISTHLNQKEVVIQPNKLLKTESIDDWIPDFYFDENMKAIDVGAGTSKTGPAPAEPYKANAQATLNVVDEPLTPAATKAAGKWGTLGKVLGYAGDAFGAATGVLQAVMGGYQLDEGIKTNNPYDIASGAINIAGGGLAVAGGVASIAGGAAAAAALPLAGIAAVAGMITLIIDILKHQNDHNKFADSLGEMFNSLGILKDGWHDKAAQAYYDSHGEPDPAPIAHGNLP